MADERVKPVLISTEEAAAMLGISPQSMRNRRSRGQEPIKYVKMGKSQTARVKYYYDDVIRYIESLEENVPEKNRHED